MNNGNIVPEKDLRRELLSVQIPGRYVGGEFGTINKDNADFTMALSFPDLYEIGMSNLALRLLYREINKLESVACERVFSPAPDFEEILTDRNIPLYTLESGKPLRSVDLIGFTVGYELAATNILAVLSTGNVSLIAAERETDEPVVIAGGPAITNPVPLGKFLDGVWIGEAENDYIALVRKMADIKKAGGNRDDILTLLAEHPNMWIPGDNKKVTRSTWYGFPLMENFTKGFIVPNISTVQDHGIIEIMRGCPSGCRFCHAGFFYRPFRQKSIEYIEAEVESLIYDYGYREITLSSLSSGDYNGIEKLIRRLNQKWQAEHISFAFPSMRVNSVTLPLLDELSKVRKSGLTFAVETPGSGKQAGLNKDVPLERIMDILTEAKNMGWNIAKFYFMTGLPFSDADEGLAIANFLNEIQNKIKIRINATIGTFIPKPHTPFQWAPQLDEQEALRRIQTVKHNVNRGIKVGYHSPFISTLEGVLTRGDEKVSDIIFSAYNRGARLDAWDEYIKKDIWRDEFEKSNIVSDIFNPQPLDNPLPWDNIDLGFSKQYLKKELNKSEAEEFTSACDDNCDHNCGICVSEVKPVIANQEPPESAIELQVPDNTTKELQNFIQNRSMIDKIRMLFSFSKGGKAVYYSHINIMQIFERSFLRGGIPSRFTEGFNPKPRLEFAHPLALGYSSSCEVAAIDLQTEYSPEDFISNLNKALPLGLSVNKAVIVIDKPGVKRKSLMSIFGGSTYTVKSESEKIVNEIINNSEIWEKRSVLIQAENPKSCIIDIKQLGKESAPGLKKVLKSVPLVDESEEAAVDVTRTDIFARKEGKLISYFDYFT
ncbi:MAG: DUF2344 domain-containing protein [Spirochaetales bacterium]|nr:DUF2344 domain-containing protein [Spirochaetales bacterium]